MPGRRPRQSKHDGQSDALAADPEAHTPAKVMKGSQKASANSVSKRSGLDGSPSLQVTTTTSAQDGIKTASEKPTSAPTASGEAHQSGSKTNAPPTALQPVSVPPTSTTADPRLGHTFYDVPGDQLAKALLGQKFVRMVDGVRLCAKIVETEAYLGSVDKAAHSYKGQSERNKAMFMQPGTAYVYNIYGMYCCLNISSQGDGCAVLIRSMEPLEGIEKMENLKIAKSKSVKSASSTAPPAAKKFKAKDLCNGPSKLCQSLNITKEALNLRDLVTDKTTWLEKGEEVVSPSNTVVSERINIGYAEEWVHEPLRFYLLGNPCVSVRNKKAEEAMKS